jgi:hypothetical protein
MMATAFMSLKKTYEWARRVVNPGTAACLSSLAVALDLELSEKHLKNIFDFVGMIIAAIGLFL